MSGRSLRATIGLILIFSLAAAGLTSLGVWQVHRRAWKLDLIARVEQRIHAAPVSPPGPSEWPKVTAARDEYRAVRMSGHYLAGYQAFVMAVTDYGSGYWVLTPFQTDQGFLVLVNRGFAPSEWRHQARTEPPVEHLTVTGLLRMSEPGGFFLRHNVPAEDRWYSRDVQAIAAVRHLSDVAPYFVDRSAAAGEDWPRGGLTVVRFPNNHLVYALTWFGLALLAAFGAVRVPMMALATRKAR